MLQDIGVNVKLRKLGDELAWVIDPDLARRFGIDAETQLSITTQDGVIVLRPAPATSVEVASKRVATRYAEVFEELAK